MKGYLEINDFKLSNIITDYGYKYWVGADVSSSTKPINKLWIGLDKTTITTLDYTGAIIAPQSNEARGLSVDNTNSPILTLGSSDALVSQKFTCPDIPVELIGTPFYEFGLSPDNNKLVSYSLLTDRDKKAIFGSLVKNDIKYYIDIKIPFLKNTVEVSLLNSEVSTTYNMETTYKGLNQTSNLYRPLSLKLKTSNNGVVSYIDNVPLSLFDEVSKEATWDITLKYSDIKLSETFFILLETSIGDFEIKLFNILDKKYLFPQTNGKDLTIPFKLVL